MMELKIPRIVIAGSTSGVGKTSISSAIIYGLKKKGYSVQPFKVGPDYIDPTYLKAISRKNVRNLDSWLMGKKELVRSFVQNSHSDISIIEGVMGYYDGFSGTSNYASTHNVATVLKAPVILVMDASKTARSLAASALGYKKFHKNSRIIGVILNKLGSKKHEELCKQAFKNIKTPVVGSVFKDSEHLQSRHLGLIPADEKKSGRNQIIRIAKKISSSIDIEKIVEICNNVTPLPKFQKKRLKKPKVTIAIALDSSFNFYYQDNIDALRREGAKIKFFSPIMDSKLPPCHGMYIGGGFPEVLVGLLEKNHKMRKTINNLAESEMPIYAECGGLMYLTKSIINGKKTHRMVGLFDCETKMTKKMILNYTKGEVRNGCVISKKSNTIHGHEFHFSKLTSLAKDSTFAYTLNIGNGIENGKDGLIHYKTLASYGHLYLDRSNYAEQFVSNCINFSRK